MQSTLSPLRYPGGKTILYEDVKNIIMKNGLKGCTYIEPFAGGAGLALKLLSDKIVDQIIINDFDHAIYCFWYSILNYSEKFCNDIKRTAINMQEWEKYKNIYENQDDHSIYEIGFSTFFLNRTNRSGIIKGGPIGGKKQDGEYKLDCRFNKKVLIEKIYYISSLKNKIKLFNYDVNDFIKKVVKKQKKNYFIYFDPPYIKKGPELYQNFFKDEHHKYLSDNIKNNLANTNWIVSYDNHVLVDELYKKFHKIQFDLNYSAGSNKIGNEVMVFSNTLIKQRKLIINKKR